MLRVQSSRAIVGEQLFSTKEKVRSKQKDASIKRIKRRLFNGTNAGETNIMITVHY